MAYMSKIYANTLASYNEKYLLDEEKLRRLMDSKYSDALKILQDFSWGESLTGEITADSILSAETAKLIEFVQSSSPTEKITDVLLAEFLFNNAKAVFKGKVSGIDVTEALYAGFEYVSDAIESDELAELPDELADCISNLNELGETRTLTPREIDMEIMRARYAYELRRAKGDSRLTKYVKTDIDLKNLMTLFRCRLLSLDKSVMNSMLIKGGSLKSYDLGKALEGSQEVYNLFFARTVYDEIFDKVGDGEQAIAEIEAGIDNYLYSLTLAGRDNFMSDNPFIGYFHRRLLELKTVKTVLVCIKNNAVDEIRKRLRAIYE